jgi:membrane-bound ClpP family serine protease
MIGMEAVAETDLALEGWVWLKGARWRAIADAHVATGERVRVTGVSGLTVHVKKEA